MPIDGFKHKEFAADLAKQVIPAIPKDIPQNEKKYIVTLVNNFCFLAGEALNKEEPPKFNSTQASIITQFIGEWAFHKSIDMIRSSIPQPLRDPILQKIAFTIFEEAKLGMIKKLPDEQLIQRVEQRVVQVYQEEINALAQKGAIPPEIQKKALTTSNIDAMAQQDNAETAKMSNKKLLKLVAMAMILKKMPQEKVKVILDSLDKRDVKFIIDNMKVENLESKLDKNIVLESLGDIQRNLPESREINIEKVLRKLNRSLSKVQSDVVDAIIKNERPNVKAFLYDNKFPVLTVFTPMMLQIISEYLEEKINDNKEKSNNN